MKFRKSLNDTLRENQQALANMAKLAGKPLHPDHAPKLPPKQTRAKAGSDGRVLEGEVQAAVISWLVKSPRVLMFLRMNSGGATWEPEPGVEVPVAFHRWHKFPDGEKMRVVDLIGYTVDARPFAIECKREDWQFSKGHGKTAVRESEQLAYLRFIRRMGGRTGFARCVEDAIAIVEAA